jgi:hypothetical protein
MTKNYLKKSMKKLYNNINKVKKLLEKEKNNLVKKIRK